MWKIADAEAQLVELAKLNEDGWDSYGAKAVSQQAINRAQELLSIVPWPIPNNNGGITLEYTCKDREDFAIEIKPDGTEDIE